MKFFEEVAADVSSSTSTQIICQVPTNAKDGKINVNGALSPENFDVIVSSAITTIQPMQGAVGKEVIITGSGLKGATVKFNTTSAIPTASEDSRLVVRVPAGATTGKISVTTLNGGTIYSEGSFTIILPPTIISFSPPNGPPGTIVTINGTHLHHNPVIQFFSQVTAAIKSISPTQLLVEVPVQASGNEKITIKTDAVNSPIPSNRIFAVIGKPDINSISPLAGTIKEVIKITGANFENVVSVNFDGVSAKIFPNPAPTATQIFVEIPGGLNATTNRTINVNVNTASDVWELIHLNFWVPPPLRNFHPITTRQDGHFLLRHKPG